MECQPIPESHPGIGVNAADILVFGLVPRSYLLFEYLLLLFFSIENASRNAASNESRYHKSSTMAHSISRGEIAEKNNRCTNFEP